jgi:hypothetical protein
VIAGLIFATSLSIPRPGPRPARSPMRADRVGGSASRDRIYSNRQFLGIIDRLLPGDFLHVAEQTQYIPDDADVNPQEAG